MYDAPPIGECGRGDELTDLDLILAKQVIALQPTLQLPDDQAGMHVDALRKPHNALFLEERCDARDESVELILVHAIVRRRGIGDDFLIIGLARCRDRKSTRLNSITNAHLVCRLLLEKKKN